MSTAELVTGTRSRTKVSSGSWLTNHPMPIWSKCWWDIPFPAGSSFLHWTASMGAQSRDENLKCIHREANKIPYSQQLSHHIISMSLVSFCFQVSRIQREPDAKWRLESSFSRERKGIQTVRKELVSMGTMLRSECQLVSPNPGIFRNKQSWYKRTCSHLPHNPSSCSSLNNMFRRIKCEVAIVASQSESFPDMMQVTVMSIPKLEEEVVEKLTRSTPNNAATVLHKRGWLVHSLTAWLRWCRLNVCRKPNSSVPCSSSGTQSIPSSQTPITDTCTQCFSRVETHAHAFGLVTSHVSCGVCS